MRPLILIGLMLLVSCGEEEGVPHAEDSNVNDPQLPPTSGRAEIEAWLAKGFYLQWHCEAAPHAARAPSPHGTDRVCSNDLLSGHTTGEYPVGASGVKELYRNGAVAGYAVYRKAEVGTSGGAWYWFERTTSGSVPADGFGDSGGARSSCVGCHQDAGLDADHPGHDFVYTQVP